MGTQTNGVFGEAESEKSYKIENKILDLGRYISVILPVYNASKYLREAISSILDQTYTNFELIAIDDGSTDDCKKIIESFQDPRIKYYYHPNQGVAKTLNRGIQLASGEFIWRHDADDISLPDKLEKEIGFLSTHPEFSLCACQIAFMTESGKVAWKYRQPNSATLGGREYMDISRGDFNPYCPITHGTVLVTTDVMRELGGYRPEFITGEDVDLWLRLIQKYKAAVLNQCLSLHRLSATSATRGHGWKNEFFRNLAFKFYDQRKEAGADDLQKELPIELPDPKEQGVISSTVRGRKFRDDFLLYLYPLHLNAGDWPEVWRMMRLAVEDGWRLPATWKAIIFPLIGKKVVRWGVRARRLFHPTR